MKTLIVGCSFVFNLSFTEFINKNKFTLFGSPGAGNSSIAARVQYEVLSGTYSQVVVLWSGINRLSFALPAAAHSIIDYQFHDKIGSEIWYHSGGMGCSGEQPETPALIRNYFRTQYLASDSKYLSTQTLRNIVLTQQLLNKLCIPTKMSFIYNIHDCHDTQHEVSHGAVDPANPWYNLVDWNCFVAKTPPWEWCTAQNGLQEIDQYHPKPECLIQWFNEQLAIDLTA